jgi:hypothetical protein
MVEKPLCPALFRTVPGDKAIAALDSEVVALAFLAVRGGAGVADLGQPEVGKGFYPTAQNVLEPRNWCLIITFSRAVIDCILNNAKILSRVTISFDYYNQAH